MLPQNTSLVGRIKITFKLESHVISDCCLGVFGIMKNEIDTIFSFIGRNGATSYGQHQHLLIPIEKYHKKDFFFFFSDSNFFIYWFNICSKLKRLPISICAHNNLLYDNISQLFFTLIAFEHKKDNNKKKKMHKNYFKKKEDKILKYLHSLWIRLCNMIVIKFHSIFGRHKCILHLSNNCVLASFIC
jgi:hypothetical protein